jgi:peptide/nickel transport system substrate-binding protein
MRIVFSSFTAILPCLLALVFIGLTACSSEQTQPSPQATVSSDASTTPATPAIGDRLVSASIGDASNLIPMIAGDSASHDVAGRLYLSLLKYDNNLALSGQLAEGWTVAEDQLSITFHLRHGLRWTDGVPLTSADCQFTLQLIQDPYTQSAFKSDYMLVNGSETPDPYTFIVHYSEPFSPALSSWASLAVLPAHIFRSVDIMNTTLSRQPQATSGPYTLKHWDAQQSILLAANPDYYDGTVWIQERLTRIIPDTATQFLELSAGRLDSMGLTPMQYTRLFDSDANLKARYKRYQYLDFGYTYLGFNLKRPMFQDVRVRRALALGIDRQEIIDGVLMGQGEAIASPYKPGTSWQNTSLTPRPFDLKKATALLDAAGWKDHDGDGWRDKEGVTLTFTLLTNNGNKQRADAATIIKERLKNLGVQVQVRLVEWSAFIENFINKRAFDAVILGWSLNPEPDQYSIWHSSQTGAREFNFLSYHNDHVDQALDAARRTFDVSKRKALYDQVQVELFNDVPVVFLYAPYALPVLSKRVHGVQQGAAGISYDSEHWFVPANEHVYQVKSIRE